MQPQRGSGTRQMGLEAWPRPHSTWLVSRGVVGLVALPRAPARPEHPATHHSPQNSGDAEAEVDKFINDNNEDDEDDDNINN